MGLLVVGVVISGNAIRRVDTPALTTSVYARLSLSAGFEKLTETYECGHRTNNTLVVGVVYMSYRMYKV